MRLPDVAVELTPKVVKEIKKLHKQANNLHIGCLPIIYIETKIEDAGGNVIEAKKYKANSFTRNFYNFLAMCFTSSYTDGSIFGEGHLNIKDKTGTVRISSTYAASIALATFWDTGYGNLPCRGVAGNSNYGIVVGAGTDNENFDSNALSAIITHGNGTGQLQYNATTLGNTIALYDAGTKTWSNTITRTFNNQSGAPINVNEIALYTSQAFTQSTYNTMIERTKFTEPKIVNNGQVLTITYTFSFTMPN
jgi:hypothetical protein